MAVELIKDPYSLDMKEDDYSFYDKVSYIEEGYDANILGLNEALLNLKEEEQKLIQFRYFEDKTQSETAKILGKSQVKISREEQKILKKIHTSLVA